MTEARGLCCQLPLVFLSPGLHLLITCWSSVCRLFFLAFRHIFDQLVVLLLTSPACHLLSSVCLCLSVFCNLPRSFCLPLFVSFCIICCQHFAICYSSVRHLHVICALSVHLSPFRHLFVIFLSSISLLGFLFLIQAPFPFSFPLLTLENSLKEEKKRKEKKKKKRRKGDRKKKEEKR